MRAPESLFLTQFLIALVLCSARLREAFIMPNFFTFRNLMTSLVCSCTLVDVSISCTVWQFFPHGFTANVHNFFAIFPLFYGEQGPFFLDNRNFPYACSSVDSTESGWFDFFETKSLGLRPWTSELEATMKGSCRILSVDDVRPLTTQLRKDSFELQLQSTLKVCP